ncbi:uncharacterized protein LOC108674698 [Hyalella azteca]|uniref:Uncharacterized protein LOC108674698 n=1 Tax=Hyalella azteca TaxID=294128 RepID=A0A8B7NWQ6_HYAAZ|nr:uncharacterized protein LOC108674698 [Hyalella azteca]
MQVSITTMAVSTSDSSVALKLSKISSFLTSFQVEKPAHLALAVRSSLLEVSNNQENDNPNLCLPRERVTNHPSDSYITSADTELAKNLQDQLVGQDKLQHNSVATYYNSELELFTDQSFKSLGKRLETYGHHRWMLRSDVLSVYKCARLGWFMSSPDMLHCSDCQERLPLILPSPSATKSYERALELLHERLLTKHLKSCRWRFYHALLSWCRPPPVLEPPAIYALVQLAHYIASDMTQEQTYLADDGVPLMNQLVLSQSAVEDILGPGYSGAQRTALLLLLTGWKSTKIAGTLRCELCKRRIGLWCFRSTKEHEDLLSPSAMVHENLHDSVVDSAMSIVTQESHAELDVPNSEARVNIEHSDITSAITTSLNVQEALYANSELNPLNLETVSENSDVQPVAHNSESSVMAEGSVSDAPMLEKSICDNVPDEIRTNKCSDSEETSHTVGARDDDDDHAMLVDEEAPSKIVTENIPCDETPVVSEVDCSIPETNEPLDTVADASNNTGKRKRPDDDDVDPAQDELPSEGDEGRLSKKTKISEDQSSNETLKVANSSESEKPPRPVLCPLGQHHAWCAWVTPTEHQVLPRDSVPPEERGEPGYRVMSEQLQRTLQRATAQRWTQSEKYSSCVEGVRSVRTLLSSWLLGGNSTS